MIRGHFLQLLVGGDVVDVRPDANPRLFWGFVVIALTGAAFSLWRGIAGVLAYLRERKIQSGVR